MDVISEIGPIGGPVWVAWREGTLTRATELEALAAWVRRKQPDSADSILDGAIHRHLEAARDAATVKKLNPHRRWRFFRNGPLMERASSNLDAAEAHILNIAPPSYVLGQLPCLLRHVRCHLVATDPGRMEFERIARSVGVGEPGDRPASSDAVSVEDIVARERGKIVTTVRAASSAALREHIQLRSFRNVVVATAVVMTFIALGVALLGFFGRTLIPLCFAPVESGTAVVVCPAAQSDRFTPSQDGVAAASSPPAAEIRDIDAVVAETATRMDLLVVELVGLTAAAIAAAAAIRRIKGSSERYGLPVALAALKLPTGALTAFLGLLLMRGQFVPGLSALDTSAQILAWALVFGYAQQLFTRLVDQQGQSVLNSVRTRDAGSSRP
ncbi:hypothetical protein BJ973_001190 [Actinoplanes tereljensis]|uniref:Uncharacterized protein n=1 Tax=Paractinoplanes tereljensis TaxID=571912 RepID=A0A919NLW0_9ACTN|nr:hypothetical protein [Actinoplanes tereljensis]GIF20903.1 hypothetical protein Ate02nite_36330 [Actinoplanes tereljensis]